MNIENIKHKVDELLEERMADYPSRGKSHDQLQKRISELTNNLQEVVCSEPEWAPSNIFIKNFNNIKDRPMFICGSMKSGTTLVTRLLDHHKQLAVMPGDSHLYKQFLSKKDVDELAHYWMRRLVNPTGQKPFWFLGENIQNYIDFLRHLYFLNDKVEFSFQAVVGATYYTELKKQDCQLKYWVEKTPQNELYSQELKNKFSHSKFLHVFREPSENIASLKKLFKLRGWNWNITRISNLIFKLLSTGIANEKVIEGYNTIRYEKLTSNVEGEMKKLSNRLQIDYDEILNIPTERGKATRSNSMYGDRSSGIVRSQGSKRWKKELSFKEKCIISANVYDKQIENFYTNPLQYFKILSSARNMLSMVKSDHLYKS